MKLRPCQEIAADEIAECLRNGGRGMWSGPPGVGKSVVGIEVQRRLGDGCWITTPRPDIMRGWIEKGANPERIATPLTLRNGLLDGRLPQAEYLIVDEGHHDTADTGEQIRLLTGVCPTVALTATPFRGTPQGTAALRELYGDPHTIITLKHATELGYVSIPTFRTVPVLDDDTVDIQGGEFRVKQVERKTPWATALRLVSDTWNGLHRHDRRMIVTLPGVASCHDLAEMLQRQEGVPCEVVTGETSETERKTAFRATLRGDAALLQVNVVNEGVDLHLRQMIDLAPTLSPVLWYQRVGRLMRPGGESVYYACNRNVLRHGYLLEGLVPCSAFGEAQSAFPAQSRRAGLRAFGLEGVGKLRPVQVPLANGLFAQSYFVTRSENYVAKQYVAIVLPNQADVLWAERLNARGKETYDYGRWFRCKAPGEMKGFASVPPRPLTERMSTKWKEQAAHWGLDPEAEIDSKSFQVLPVLWDLKLKIK